MTRNLRKEVAVFLITFFSISFVVLLLWNGNTYWRTLRYSLFLNSPFASNELKESDLLDVKPIAEAATVVIPGVASGGYALVIPKMEITTPIAVPKANTKESVLASLEEGVGLYPGSAEPGEIGRVMILGHSSRASWYRGEYAYVFSRLSTLKEFDLVYITGYNKKYIYQVFANKTLTPQETNDFVAIQPGDSELNLITCYPVGSASKRTLIQAKLIGEEAI